MMHSPRHPILLAMSALLLISACGAAPPSPQANTAPLRSGQQVAKNVGDSTREVQAKNPELVRYDTSIDEEPEAKDAQTPSKGGTITIDSVPRGEIVLDGKPLGVSTPHTLDASKGSHELQIIFQGGDTSEVKLVRIDEGSRAKLFFRDGAPPEPPVTQPISPGTKP